MKNILLLLAVVVLFTGCAHCSVTLTKFDGKTKGLNPYGDGNIDVIREAYWGFKACILKLVERSGVESVDQAEDIVLTSDSVSTAEEILAEHFPSTLDTK